MHCAGQFIVPHPPGLFSWFSSHLFYPSLLYLSPYRLLSITAWGYLRSSSVLLIGLFISQIPEAECDLPRSLLTDYNHSFFNFFLFIYSLKNWSLGTKVTCTVRLENESCLTGKRVRVLESSGHRLNTTSFDVNRHLFLMRIRTSSFIPPSGWEVFEKVNSTMALPITCCRTLSPLTDTMHCQDYILESFSQTRVSWSKKDKELTGQSSPQRANLKFAFNF